MRPLSSFRGLFSLVVNLLRRTFQVKGEEAFEGSQLLRPRALFERRLSNPSHVASSYSSSQ